ncbi:MAG: AI-2E family transporter [Chloroflexota bacterium]
MQPAVGRELWRLALRVVAIGTAVAVGIWLVVALRTVLLQVLIAIFLATGLGRLTDRLERAGLPRWAAVAIAFAGLLAGIVVTVVAVVLPLLQEVDALMQNLPRYRDFITHALQEVQRVLPFLPQLDQLVAGATENLVTGVGAQAAEPHTVAQVALGFVGRAISAMLVLIITLYLLADRDSIRSYLLAFVPPARRARVGAIADRVGDQTGGWLVGQATICAIVGGLTFIGLVLIGVRSAVLLAMIAALGELIPLVGPGTAALLAVLVAATQSPLQAVATLIYILALQQIDSYFLGPRIMGHAVKIHPLAVVLALLIGVELVGPIGALVAAPIAAAVSILLDELRSGAVAPEPKGPDRR